MVVWIDSQLKNSGSHKEGKYEVRSFYFDNKTILEKFPRYGEFTLVVAKYDAFAPIIVGYNRYKNCQVVDVNEGKIMISVKTVYDNFYNQSQSAELRADKIESLKF